jgi:ProP effector
MSNASLKEQLQAVASQLTEKTSSEMSSSEKPGSEKISPEKISPANIPKRKFQRETKPLEKINRPKPKWLDYAQYGVELLRAYYPACFRAPNDVKPLKKGIKQDLVKRLSEIETIVTEDKACMVKSLSYYVNTAAYHKSMQDGTVRIDLDGNPDGTVTAEEAKYSLERQQAKLLAKQNAKSGVK